MTARITETASAAQQISAETNQMENSASTQEIAASAQELARTAESLQELVGRVTLTAEPVRLGNRPASATAPVGTPAP
jgi:methyl-accepting chemotaxis protein